MDKDQIRHKCGYCGWLFSFSTNFVDHECFKHYVEDEDRIYVDENYVVTILEDNTDRNPKDPVCRDTLDELLIGAVQARRRLYDNSTPAFERTNLCKNALWAEVSNTLGGAITPEEAKSRWKYLRDNYVKARKKAKSYVPSGSAAKAEGGVNKKSKFKFYELMNFLNDFIDTRPTVSSLPDNAAERESNATATYHEDYTVASCSWSTNTPTWKQPTVDIYPQMQTTTRVPLRMPTPTLVSPRTTTPLVSPRTTTPLVSPRTTTPLVSPRTTTPLVSPRTTTPNSVSLQSSPALSMTSLEATNSRGVLQTFNRDMDVPRRASAAKKQKTDIMQAALMDVLKEPMVQASDPLDGFLARVGEGMRRLPYRNRAQLEITFLTLLAEMELNCANEYPTPAP